MIKRAVAAVVVGLVCIICVSGFAQQTVYEPISVEDLRKTGEVDVGSALTLDRPDSFNTVDSVLLLRSLPVTTMLDGRRFPISGQSHGMFNLFPVAFLTEVDVHKVPSPMLSTESPVGVVDLRLNKVYAGGELGIFYGKTDGKYSTDLFQTYIMGGVGNDKFQISAGAMYEESSGSGLRLQR